jgi:hydroxyethylthiazole kinase
MTDCNDTLEKTCRALDNLRERVPLIQCITNKVTVNDCANALLAIGASPLMSDEVLEQREIVSIEQGLVVNIGTITQTQAAAAFIASDEADKTNTPIVIDPVGFGVSNLRNSIVSRIQQDCNVSVIRGNMSEIKAMANYFATIYNYDLEVESTKAKGVDVADSDVISSSNLKNNGTIVKILADKLNTVVMASGPIDIISDGNEIYTIRNGDEIMPRITGSGCMLSSLVGGFVGSNDDKFIATIAAGLVMAISGEIAAEYCKKNNFGSGTFRNILIDELYKIDKDTILKRAKLEKLEI